MTKKPGDLSAALLIDPALKPFPDIFSVLFIRAGSARSPAPAIFPAVSVAVDRKRSRPRPFCVRDAGGTAESLPQPI